MRHLRLLRLWHGHRALFAALVALRLGAGATWVAQALALAQVFTLLVRGEGAVTAELLLTPLGVLAAALVARPVLTLTGQLVAHRAMTSVKRELRARALTALVHRGARDVRARSGADHALVVDGVESIDPYLSGYLPQVIVTVVTTVILGGVMIVIDPAAGLTAAAAALLVPTLPRLWAKLLARRGGDQWAAYEALQAEFVDSMTGMTTLVSYGAEKHRERQLAAASASLLARTIAQLRLSLLDSGLATLALVGVPAVVLLAVGLRADVPEAATVFTLVLLSIELVRPLRDLSALWHAGYVGTFSGAALVDLLSAEEARRARRGNGLESSGPDGGGRRHRARPGADVVELRNVVVAHEDAATAGPALDVDALDLQPGLTAVVGRSGAGKSTLAAVLVGLSAPRTGDVLIDGVPTVPEDRLAIFALVPQDPALLGGTVAEEIARGIPPAERAGAAERVRAAADVVGIGSDDPALALHSPVGEGGALLSGGQRQRVAVARGLVQERAVLILDEATSALDPAAEAQLIERVRVAHPFVVAITHREAVARVADRVVALAEGRRVDVPTSEPVS